jgi:voltage-gated potassium channel
VIHFLEWLRRHRLLSRNLPRVLVIVVLMNLLFGTLFYFAERGAQTGLSLADGLWWAMVTMTTVGYGDHYAKTAVGRFLVSYPAMIVGIGLVAYLAGTVAEAVINRLSQRRKGLLAVDMQDHFVICNCPSTEKVLQFVAELRYHSEHTSREVVLVSERFEELPAELARLDIRYVRGNPTQEDVLARACALASVGVFVFAIDPTDPGSDAATLAIGLTLSTLGREQNADVRVIVQLASKKNERMMRRAGVDGIVFDEGVSDSLMAQEFVNPGVHAVVQEVISNRRGSQFYIHETTLAGRRIKDLQLAVIEHSTNMQLIGIINGDKIELNPDKNRTIQKGDRLIVLADEAKDFPALQASLGEMVQSPS